jgi:hypothetical protein
VSISRILLPATFVAAACSGGSGAVPPERPAPPPPPVAEPEPPAPEPGTFAADVAFLREHTDVVVLSRGPARVAVAPIYQGRVMTSAATEDGRSYGFIHRETIASGERRPHMNVFGGEDRFWLGPEGGQYALYFAPGDPFDLEHWQVPEPIDWGGWEVVEQSESEIRFRKEMSLESYARTRFDLRVDRTVRMLSIEQIAEHLGTMPGDAVYTVAYESENTITNTGEAAWRRETGLVSIWILGMYNPSPSTTVVLPYRPGPAGRLGPVVNASYFGDVPPERLEVADHVVYFRADGDYRSKIGIPRPRAVPIAGSYDAQNGVLTLVQYTLPEDATDYVSSLWEEQRRPYAGDVVNSYNDGPPERGAPPLGPFYEIETSSPATALARGESLTHVHRTIHLQSDEESLDPIARATLGVGIEEIIAAFP